MSQASLLFVSPTGIGEGNTFSDPANVSSIQSRIVQNDLLHVLLLPGTYFENLSISSVPANKRLTIEGAPSLVGRPVFMDCRIEFLNCSNVTLRSIQFRQSDLTQFRPILTLVGCSDCIVEFCNWQDTSSKFGTATIFGNSERIVFRRCTFVRTGNRNSSGSGAHQLYVAGGADAASSGYVRNLHIIECKFYDNYGGQHLKFKNGASKCFVNHCFFRRRLVDSYHQFILIADVGDPDTGYPRVTDIFVVDNRLTNDTAERTHMINRGPTGRPLQYIFASNSLRAVEITR